MTMKVQKKAPLSAMQMEIMQIVWLLGEASVASVSRELSKKRTLARNTILTLLTRLEKKGWLRHRQEGNTYIYTATADRHGTLREMVSRMVDTVFAGSAEGLVMALLEGRGISTEEATRIETIIDRARTRNKGTKGKS